MDMNLDGFCICYLDADRKPGPILREQRVTQNMSQSQVAKKANITTRQYQKFESGERNIRTASFNIACRVLDALNMDIEGFYKGKYVIGEETFTDEKGVMHYKKTGKAVDEDVVLKNDSEVE